VDLYFIRTKQRRLSLRFLSWFVLHEHIQTDTHDSIEDARSALKLYKAYHELEERGIFDQKLEELYKQGRLYVSSCPPTRDIGLTPLTQEFQTSDQYRRRGQNTATPSGMDDSICLPYFFDWTGEPWSGYKPTEFHTTYCVSLLELASMMLIPSSTRCCLPPPLS